MKMEQVLRIGIVASLVLFQNSLGFARVQGTDNKVQSAVKALARVASEFRPNKDEQTCTLSKNGVRILENLSLTWQGASKADFQKLVEALILAQKNRGPAHITCFALLLWQSLEAKDFPAVNMFFTLSVGKYPVRDTSNIGISQWWIEKGTKWVLVARRIPVYAGRNTWDLGNMWADFLARTEAIGAKWR